MKMKAETGGMRPRAQGRLERPEAGRGGKDPPLEPPHFPARQLPRVGLNRRQHRGPDRSVLPAWRPGERLSQDAETSWTLLHDVTGCWLHMRP